MKCVAFHFSQKIHRAFGPLLIETMSPRTFKNRPIWSHWVWVAISILLMCILTLSHNSSLPLPTNGRLQNSFFPDHVSLLCSCYTIIIINHTFDKKIDKQISQKFWHVYKFHLLLVNGNKRQIINWIRIRLKFYRKKWSDHQNNKKCVQWPHLFSSKQSHWASH